MLHHILVAGASGTGKSLLMLLLARRLIEAGVQVIWIDTKRQGRALLNWGLPVCVLTPKTFRFGLLQASADVQPDTHLAHTFEVLQLLDLRVATRGVFMKVAKGLYEAFGIYRGSDIWPTLLDEVEGLKAIRPRSQDKEYGQAQGG